MLALQMCLKVARVSTATHPSWSGLSSIYQIISSTQFVLGHMVLELWREIRPHANQTNLGKLFTKLRFNEPN